MTILRQSTELLTMEVIVTWQPIEGPARILPFYTMLRRLPAHPECRPAVRIIRLFYDRYHIQPPGTRSSTRKLPLVDNCTQYSIPHPPRAERPFLYPWHDPILRVVAGTE